jgi:glycerol-3-phosphate dehydrogenase
VHALLLPANRKNGSGVPGTGRISFVPWRGRTLIGARAVVEGSEGVTITERDIEDFLVAIRAAHPRANLDRERLVYAFSALDYGESRDSSSRARRGAALADHETTHGTRGLITAHAGGFVSSRLFAEKLVDLAFTKLGREGRPCETRVSPLDGAVKRVHDYAVRETSRSPEGLDGEVVRELVLRHGARYREVLRHGKGNPALLERVSTQRATLLASVLHAARHEMAMTLADVVLRRTGLATIGHPGWKCLERCASLLGLEHGWTAARQEEEIASVEKLLRPFSPAAEGSKAKSLARNQTRASSGWVELETSGREPAIPASSVSTDSPSK